ncbi:MAG: SRPBCC family protein [Cytophagales bacterium]|nr:SRPBCC family protein [Cytophaga sp.]
MIITILLILVGIVALLLIVAAFVKKDYVIEREIVIHKPKEEVFQYLKFLKNQDNYNKWVMADPNMKKAFRGTDGTVGFAYAWNGKEAGEGEQEISNIVEGERVDFELRFKRPMENTAYAYLITTAVSASETKVTWGMKGHSPYPLNLMSMVMGGFLGKDIETSMGMLKNVLEKK